MTIKAKEVLKNKFWLVENDGEKIGTLSYDNDKYMLNDSTGHCHYFNSQTAFAKQVLIAKINWTKLDIVETAPVEKIVQRSCRLVAYLIILSTMLNVDYLCLVNLVSLKVYIVQDTLLLDLIKAGLKVFVQS